MSDIFKVTLGAVYGAQVDSFYFQSMMNLLMCNRPPGFEFANASVSVRSGPLLAAGRGHLIGNFLEHTNGDAMVTIDTDQVFDPERFWDLVASYKELKEGRVPDLGVLAGITWMTGHPKLRNPVPNFWQREGVRGQFIQGINYPENSLIEVAAVGWSNLIVGRDCAEAITKTASGRPMNPFHHTPILNWELLAQDCATWDDPEKIELTIRQAVFEADQLGEDLSCCIRIRDHGFRILVHTGLEFAHSKNYVLDADDYRISLAKFMEAQEPSDDQLDSTRTA